MWFGVVRDCCSIIRNGAEVFADGVVRREAGLPITFAGRQILNVSIDLESGSKSIFGSTPSVLAYNLTVTVR